MDLPPRTPTSPPATPPPRRVIYALHHWPGDLSLPVAFWLDGAGTTALPIAAALGKGQLGIVASPRPVTSAYVVAFVFLNSCPSGRSSVSGGPPAGGCASTAQAARLVPALKAQGISPTDRTGACRTQDGGRATCLALAALLRAAALPPEVAGAPARLLASPQ